MTIDDLAAHLTVHRSIAYRLLRTLEDHKLVSRDSSGIVTLGPRMATLAAGVSQDLQAKALPQLTAAANDLGMTCFLVVLDGDECTTLVGVEPRHAIASVAQRPGARHSIFAGAPGKAILSEMDPNEWIHGAGSALSADVMAASLAGYATSHDEVIPNVHSVAVSLRIRGQRPAAVAVVYVAAQADVAAIAARLHIAARAIRDSFGG
ncbi:IclR family transcriptional regulator [Cryobacterium sp. SO1]|uniref:IclR family transcriptional regulator n=1 Tax=Cryobacterium sp. SO1 TaxID=1897061 RepID=UPI00351EEBD3